MQQRRYIAIDMKSFYASVECVERKLNPLDTCLVVADASRLEKRFVLPRNPIVNYASKLPLYIRGGKNSKSQEFFVPLQVEF